MGGITLREIQKAIAEEKRTVSADKLREIAKSQGNTRFGFINAADTLAREAATMMAALARGNGSNDFMAKELNAAKVYFDELKEIPDLEADDAAQLTIKASDIDTHYNAIKIAENDTPKPEVVRAMFTLKRSFGMPSAADRINSPGGNSTGLDDCCVSM